MEGLGCRDNDAVWDRSVPLIEEATRLEFAGGVSAKLGRVSLYAQAGYQFGLDGAFIRNGIQGDIGLRYVW